MFVGIENVKSNLFFNANATFLGAISLISMSSTANGIDWSCAREWSALHLAVKHDVECLKLLLYTLQHRLDPDTMEQVLAARDSR